MPSIKILVLLTTLQIAAATKEPILPISNSAVVSYPHGFSTSSPDSSEDLLLDGSSILPSPLGHSKMHKRSGAAIEDTEYVF